MLHVVQATSRLNCQDRGLSCQGLSSHGCVVQCSLPLELVSSTGALFVDDCSFNVRAGFVFGVDDARFLVALQYHFLMARCKHVLGKCSFCVTMTRALAKYHVSKECSRQSVIASKDGDWRSILTHKHAVSGELRHAAGDSTHVRSVDTSFGRVNASVRVVQLLTLSAIQGRFQGSRVALQRICSVLLEAHPHPGSASSGRLLRRRVGSQPIHPTSTTEIDSMSSQLVENRTTSAAEHKNISSVANLVY